MSKEMQYHVIKSEDISIAMESSAKSTNHSLKMGREDGLVWAQTVSVVMERLDKGSLVLDTSKEGIQKIGDVVKNILSTHILSVTTIPENGKDREGKDFRVCGKDGMPKWSSWDKTRRIWAYAGDIAKVLAHGLSATLYPEKYKVAARCDILEQCKGAETPVKAVERLGKQIQLNLDKMSTVADVLQARKIVSTLSVNNLEPLDEASDLIDKLDAILSSVPTDIKDDIRGLMAKIVVHFT